MIESKAPERPAVSCSDWLEVSRGFIEDDEKGFSQNGSRESKR
jgi:hypothetical protein